MKWLITGANGQLGRCLQDRLAADAAAEVFATDSHTLDITNRQVVFNAIQKYQPDVVINAAAYTAVDKAESDVENATRVNTDAPGYLAEACEQSGIWFAHVSTDYVFDGTENVAYKETDVTNPTSIYGRTKLEGEHRVAEQCSRYLILRTAWVFSEYGNNFVKTMVKLGQERDQLSVVADQIGCPTYAGDIAKALVTMLKMAVLGDSTSNSTINVKSANSKQNISDKPSMTVESGIYHYAGDVAVSWWSFAREIHEYADKAGKFDSKPILAAIPTEAYPTPAKRPAFSVLDCSKIMALGVFPSDWRTRLIDIVAKS